MPLYEYQCNACGEQYDEYRSIADRDKRQPCPKCGSRDTQRAMATLLRGSAPSLGAACTAFS